jgi:hypothetical protein
MANFLDGKQPPAQPISLTVDMAETLKCQNCEHTIFVEGIKVLRFSKLLTGTPQDVIQPIPVFLCGNCGAVNEELLPKELKDKT